MQHVISDHRQQVLAHLRALDPVQIQLSKRLAARTPRRIVRWGHALVDTLRRWRQRHATIRALNALSNWQLADIGIQREAIPAAVDIALADATERGSRSKATAAATDRLAA